MKSYNHFTLSERENLSVMKKEGKSLRKIAETLGKNVSSISRELKRNGNKDQSYTPWRATSLYIYRRKKSVRKYRLESDKELNEFTQDCLAKYWSPELIVSLWKLKYPESKLSYSTIYKAIKIGLLRGFSRKTHLRRKGKRRNPKGYSTTIKPVNLISRDWTKEIKERAEVGHWEGDTMLGGIGKGALVTLVDRKTRFLIAKLIYSKNQYETKEAIISALVNAPATSISLDNGSEFALFKQLETTINTKVYFADPHSPWQRPTNEYTNGLLRFFFPKGFDFRTITQHDVDYAVYLLNSRPRKCLDFLSPLQLFYKCCT